MEARIDSGMPSSTAYDSTDTSVECSTSALQLHNDATCAVVQAAFFSFTPFLARDMA